MPKAPKAKEKAPTIRIPPIAWTANDYYHTWRLVAEIEEHRKVLLGAEPGERITVERKSVFYRNTAEKLFPELFAINAKMVAERIKAKTEELLKTYREKAKLLNTTGAGLGSEDGVHKYSDGYIGASGPEGNTSEGARNIWDEICLAFPFFPNLHRLLSSKPNMRPPALTTGVGPQGCQVIHIQPPESSQMPSPSQITLPEAKSFNANIDPQSHETQASSHSTAHLTSSSTQSDDSEVIYSGWRDQIFMLAKANLDQQRSKAADELACRREENALKRRKVCLQEQELIGRQLRDLRQDLRDGLLDNDEYRDRAKTLRLRSDEIFKSSQTEMSRLYPFC